MEKNSNLFNSFNYIMRKNFLSSDKRQVCVIFKYQDKCVKKVLDIKKNETNPKDQSYYIDEARKMINRMIKSGELKTYAENYIHKINQQPKKILLASSGALLVTSVVFISLFVWKMASGNNVNDIKITFNAGENAIIEKFETDKLTIDVHKGSNWGDLFFASHVSSAMKDDYDFLGWSIDGSTLIADDYVFDKNTDLIPIFVPTSTEYLTFIPRYNNTKFIFNPMTWYDKCYFYSYSPDFSDPHELIEGEELPTVNVGQRIFLKGDDQGTGNRNKTFNRISIEDSSVINADKPFTLSGNINSMVVLTSQKQLYDSAFNYSFVHADNLISAHNLYLGSDIIISNSAAYKGLFGYDTNLIYAPKLPNLTLKSECYSEMFFNTGIIEAPELPATELAYGCYSSMFRGCKNLTEAPYLPAIDSELKDTCYAYMFAGCTNLNSVSVAFSFIDAWSYQTTYCWLQGVMVSGSFTWNGLTDRTDLINKGYLDVRGNPQSEEINHIPHDWVVSQLQ